MKFIDLESQQNQIRFEIDEALNKQPAFKTEEFDVEISTKVSEKVVSLPMHPYLSETDQQKVVKKCTDIIKGKYK